MTFGQFFYFHNEKILIFYNLVTAIKLGIIPHIVKPRHFLNTINILILLDIFFDIIPKNCILDIQ